ncbi:MAG: hypothetical protein HXS54_12485 [Theionarchaea archaeon]|nr:hypothetical protein [Theionarchaea archaeon]
MGFENFNEHSEGRVCSYRFDYEKKTSWFLKGKSIRVQGNDENRLYQPPFEYMQYLCGGNGIHVVRDTYTVLMFWEQQMCPGFWVNTTSRDLKGPLDNKYLLLSNPCISLFPHLLS